MQYDQCLTRGPDNSAVIITHCDQNQNKEWKYFKVRHTHTHTQTGKLNSVDLSRGSGLTSHVFFFLCTVCVCRSSIASVTCQQVKKKYCFECIALLSVSWGWDKFVGTKPASSLYVHTYIHQYISVLWSVYVSFLIFFFVYMNPRRSCFLYSNYIHTHYLEYQGLWQKLPSQLVSALSHGE